jgi:hypothetical protein
MLTINEFTMNGELDFFAAVTNTWENNSKGRNIYFGLQLPRFQCSSDWFYCFLSHGKAETSWRKAVHQIASQEAIRCEKGASAKVYSSKSCSLQPTSTNQAPSSTVLSPPNSPLKYESINGLTHWCRQNRSGDKGY